MTGAEVVIKQGDKICIGKVCHDGQDTREWFKQQGDKLFDIPMKELWSKYMAYRASLYGTDDEIETNYPNGFFFKFQAPIVGHLLDIFGSLLATGETHLSQVDPDDGYNCSYSDRFVLIDYDKREVPDLDHEEEDKWEPRKLEDIPDDEKIKFFEGFYNTAYEEYEEIKNTGIASDDMEHSCFEAVMETLGEQEMWDWYAKNCKDTE